MNDYDQSMMPWLELFSRYDLYSKNDETFNIKPLEPYYKQLIEKYLPGKISWEMNTVLLFS